MSGLPLTLPGVNRFSRLPAAITYRWFGVGDAFEDKKVSVRLPYQATFMGINHYTLRVTQHFISPMHLSSIHRTKNRDNRKQPFLLA